MEKQKCNWCKEMVDPEETLYKIKHKDKLYFFCCQCCKNDFQKKHFGQVIY